MTTELVILLALCLFVIVGVFKTPAASFERAGPHLGMRIEKNLETGVGFEARTQSAQHPISWAKK